MLQHAIGASRGVSHRGGPTPDGQNRFVASHAFLFLPGSTLKKIAITEMRHAEAIAERVVLLGGEPTTQPAAITIGDSARQMLEIDRAAEEAAIDLYTRIIGVARGASDEVTTRLFEKILADEQKHRRVFADLLRGLTSEASTFCSDRMSASRPNRSAGTANSPVRHYTGSDTTLAPSSAPWRRFLSHLLSRYTSQ
jgi:bacterioferritin